MTIDAMQGMFRSPAASLVQLVLLLSASLAASAQLPPVREGFGVSYGPALMLGSIECSSCGMEEAAGIGGYLRLGQYRRPDLFLGIEASLYTLPLVNRYETQSVAAVAQWYPQVNKGFFVRGSAGVAWLQEENNDDEDEARKYSLTTPTLGISIGYDVRSRRRFLLTPFASVTQLLGGNVHERGVADRRASGTLVQVGVGFTWY